MFSYGQNSQIKILDFYQENGVVYVKYDIKQEFSEYATLQIYTFQEKFSVLYEENIDLKCVGIHEIIIPSFVLQFNTNITCHFQYCATYPDRCVNILASSIKPKLIEKNKEPIYNKEGVITSL